MFDKKAHPTPPIFAYLPVFEPALDPVWGCCLDCSCRWASYSMDDLFREISLHEGLYRRHIVHVYD